MAGLRANAYTAVQMDGAESISLLSATLAAARDVEPWEEGGAGDLTHDIQKWGGMLQAKRQLALDRARYDNDDVATMSATKIQACVRGTWRAAARSRGALHSCSSQAPRKRGTPTESPAQIRVGCLTSPPPLSPRALCRLLSFAGAGFLARRRLPVLRQVLERQRVMNVHIAKASVADAFARQGEDGWEDAVRRAIESNAPRCAAAIGQPELDALVGAYLHAMT